MKLKLYTTIDNELYIIKGKIDGCFISENIARKIKIKFLYTQPN